MMGNLEMWLFQWLQQQGHSNEHGAFRRAGEEMKGGKEESILQRDQAKGMLRKHEKGTHNFPILWKCLCIVKPSDNTRTDCCTLPASGTKGTSAAAAQSWINTDSALLELLFGLLTPSLLSSTAPLAHRALGTGTTSLLCEHSSVSQACLGCAATLEVAQYHRPFSAALLHHFISPHRLKHTLGTGTSIAATVYNPVSKNAKAPCAEALLTSHPQHTGPSWVPMCSTAFSVLYCPATFISPKWKIKTHY